MWYHADSGVAEIRPVSQGGFDMVRKSMLVLGFGVAVLVSTVAFQVSLSNDGKSKPAPAPVLEADDDDPFNPEVAQEAPRFRKPEAPASRQTASLRQRFVELTAKRAQRMSDEELGQAVEEISKMLADQDTEAEAALEQAADLLKSVVEKFPGTPSAERAYRALEAIKAKPVLRDLDDEGSDRLSSAATRPPARPILPKQKQPRTKHE
jgi:hypothetical protein